MGLIDDDSYQKYLETFEELYDPADGIMEMARVGWLDDALSGYELYVQTDDAGEIPHFHLKHKNQTKSKSLTIEILRPIYFERGTHKGTLNSKERNSLQAFISDKSSNARYNGTNWDMVVDLWNDNNSNRTIPTNMKQPDYVTLHKETSAEKDDRGTWYSSLYDHSQ